MKNQREIYEALLAGETLIDESNNSARLNGLGELINRINRNAPDNFLFPNQWQIYKEKKWYENIPDGGVLCWCKDGESDKEVTDIVTEQGSANGYFTPNLKHWIYATPLTLQEIQAFMDNAPEDL